MGKTMEHLEAGGGGSSHIFDILQSGGAGGATVQCGDVGDINGRGEAIIRGTNVFFTTGEREKGKRSLYRNYQQERAESILKVAGTQYVRTYIDRRQAMVVQWVALRPLFEFCAQQETGYEGGGADITPVVVADGIRCAITGHIRRDFGITKGAEATLIWKGWQEGGVDGIM